MLLAPYALEECLLQLPHLKGKRSNVRTLIDPSDHQNVPRATKLIKAVISLKDEVERDELSPTQMKELTGYILLGELFNALLDPFINPSTSLSERLQLLSTYAHLAFALFKLHGPSFMTGQLYSDTQSLVKCCYFMVAQQQILDDSQPMFLHLIGSDRLEEQFCELRTETHDRNCDTLQVCERLSTSAERVSVYSRHPSWRKSYRRMSYTGREDEVDHVNPTFFTGNLIVCNVDLQGVWDLGRSNA
ncbi:hypothetical protein CONPUDRAFT_52515, partial [Coniophora puteana RWD-64-598 SS2]